jgi:putative SOS response-associated peptidase YedK
MCGRFNVESDPLSRLLMELVQLPHPGPDNHNLAPTEPVAVLRRDGRGEPQLLPMRWWLTPYWAKDAGTRYSMFNAKAETVAESRAFREPFRKRRCVVPVSGFYEWVRSGSAAEPGASPQKQKLPFYLRPREQPGMLLAGIWDRWRSGDGDGGEGSDLLSFAILTTAASDQMAFLHHRQPLMLSTADAACWLDGTASTDQLNDLLRPRVPVPLEAVPVSTWVNNARHKDQRCLEPIGVPVAVASDAAAAGAP